MSDLTSLTLTQVRDKLAAKDVSATETTTTCIDRIAATEPSIKALLHYDPQNALDQAKALDAAGRKPEQTLFGVPLVIKDAICVKDAPTTCASKILERFVPFYDAFVIERLKSRGAVILGKANMDEFAMGSSTENSAFAVTRNPWDLERVPGGSSGGSAASVAAGQCFAALGTDTGGSIRQPASFCGVVGLKPTYGRVSRYGLVAYGSSLDQIGPLTRTPADAAAVLTAIAGHDPRDSTCSPSESSDYESELAKATDLKGVRLGVPEEYWGEGVDDEVRSACQSAIDSAAELGAEIVPVSMPHTKYAVATYYVLAMAEASSNLARFDGVRYGYRDPNAEELIDMYETSRTTGFGDEVKRRIMLGTYVLSAGYYDAYYRKAARVRRLIRQDYLDAFERCDILVGPVSPFTAFKVDEKTADPLQMYLSDIFTLSLNLAGLPGLSLPVGLGSVSSMPIGLQMIGPAFSESSLLCSAHVLAKAMPTMTNPSGLV
ncbi:Asp-tRNA(Asn)/Glu-tRNA(Gln) amidotransferase subunit GatA [Desulfovibrio inopinatus]|uniref:Asp-tRNA(Asn)/Glu-tRNA(Gln) amidotransferase subunit GatA n=1 Tax=Desulfovibrio inopinatus TaxID=102109 RepID=UPI0004092F05|nr:Asp-tRNA(Asn)/Glu-tRNA(Gln) amidotransferase subunit GatA [Desulfovibrio inopinatus]